MKNLLQKHASVFGNENHPIADSPRAKLGFKTGCHPKYSSKLVRSFTQWHRRWKKKIDNPIKIGVIEPVAYSNWATPIILVLKSDGKIWICSDWIDVDSK